MLMAFPVLADEMERVPPITDRLTKEECGACHMAFQPAFLPAASWRRIMADLSNHFGEDASLAPQETQAIEAYLIRHAGYGGRGGTGETLRITDLRWWRHEHLDEGDISRTAWQKAGSQANCAACHAYAEQGLYEDD